ncbi:tRNA (guanosine(37)-N1)-methyltransferase TrmD [Patescibacteria group bacterium]|nr:tRNA (guanosine(37)-N1)-methyltransferase TrmD [Patescibacteria group bacterium]
MKFDIITIFPDIFKSYFKESLIGKAIKNKLISVNIHNLRDWADGKHKTVDDKPFGGGLGMVMKVEPIFKAVADLKKSQIPNPKSQTSPKFKAKNSKTKVILFTPRGQKFNQKIAHQLSKSKRIIMICGRYEGVDERVAKNIADLELSIGDYDLMGGELPAMIVVETISRLVPKVIGKKKLLKERITKSGGFIEYAQYTRPEVFKKWRVPEVLTSGDHKKIKEWREKNRKIIEN